MGQRVLISVLSGRRRTTEEDNPASIHASIGFTLLSGKI